MVRILGIVNLTGDSFYAGSRTAVADVAARVKQMWADGATAVDLGACSTRPGAPQPSLEEEWARLEPALRILAGIQEGITAAFARTGSRSGAEVIPSCIPPISIDTYRSEIVRRAYDLIGPFMVNDISAGALDPQMLAVVGRLGLPYVAMHMRGTPETMQQLTQYGDLVGDIKAYFRDFALRAEDAGIRE